MSELAFAILVQGLGFLGTIAGVLCFQFKSHRTTMVLRTLNESLFAIQLLLLGAYTGAAVNIFGSVRNLIFADLVQKNKSTRLTKLLFTCLFAVFILLTWSGPQSLLPGIAKIASTFIYGNSSTTVIRIGVLFTSSLWLIYDAFVGSIAGVFCEVLTLLSIVVGLIRLDKKK